jgi:hypothetical protein
MKSDRGWHRGQQQTTFIEEQCRSGWLARASDAKLIEARKELS